VDNLTVYGKHLVIQQVPQGSVPAGMKLYYSFDTDQGATVSDQSGNEYAANVSGATWTSDGKVGGAYAFDGNDSITRSAGNFLQLGNGAFTLAAWISVASYQNWRGIVVQGDIIRSTVSGFGIFVTQGGLLDFRVRQGAPCLDVSTPTSIPLNTWLHVVAVRDTGGQNTTLRFYVNGQLVNTAVSASTFDVSSTEPFYVGRDYYFYHGLIDEVLLYPRALSETGVQDLYTYAGGPFPEAKMEVRAPAAFFQGVQYVAPLGDLSMGPFTEGPVPENLPPTP